MKKKSEIEINGKRKEIENNEKRKYTIMEKGKYIKLDFLLT